MKTNYRAQKENIAKTVKAFEAKNNETYKLERAADDNGSGISRAYYRGLTSGSSLEITVSASGRIISVDEN